MSVFDEYERNADLNEAGAWVELRPGIEFQIRSRTSKIARGVVQRMINRNPRLFRSGQALPTEILDTQDIELCAEALVVNWRGAKMVDRDGAPIPYSKDKCRELMKALPDLRADITEVAGMKETYKTEALADIAGNSENSSGGISNGG